MLEKQGKDAHHYKSVLSVIYFFKQVLVFVCLDTHAHTHWHCLSFVFCSRMFMCVALITRVCVTCERRDMSKPAPGMETR